MAIKDNFANMGLYRLWVVFFWVWVIGFIALGGIGATKKEYVSYERQAYCDRIAIAEGNPTGQLNLACSIKIQSGEAKIRHNTFLLLLWIAGALLIPPFWLYYFYRIASWVVRGFRHNKT